MPTPNVTNFFPGISVADPAVDDIDRWLVQDDPFRHTKWYDDFHKYTAGDWTLTETQAGATEALATGHGGQLLITNTSANADLASIQLGTTSFAFASGRKAWMKFRVKSSEANTNSLFLGLSVTDTSPIASLPTESASFYKATGATTWAFLTRSGSATLQSTTMGTFAANTFCTLGMHYDGGANVYLFYNGVSVGTVNAAFASQFPTVDMQVTMAVQAGAAAAYTTTIDYGLVQMERA